MVSTHRSVSGGRLGTRSPMIGSAQPLRPSSRHAIARAYPVRHCRHSQPQMYAGLPMRSAPMRCKITRSAGAAAVQRWRSWEGPGVVFLHPEPLQVPALYPLGESRRIGKQVQILHGPRRRDGGRPLPCRKAATVCPVQMGRREREDEPEVGRPACNGMPAEPRAGRALAGPRSAAVAFSHRTSPLQARWACSTML